MTTFIVGRILEFLQSVKFKLSLDRKRFVLSHIRRYKSRKILEIGVFNGNFAQRMLKVASDVNSQPIIYVGVDLFAPNFSQEIRDMEVSLTPTHREFVQKLLNFPNVDVTLHEGFSSKVLPTLQGEFDLIVIDGGHSYETVKQDFLDSLPLLNIGGFIIFDDFTNYRGEKFGKFGINQVISEIDRNKFQVKISKNKDWFWKPYGALELRMVKVSKFS